MPDNLSIVFREAHSYFSERRIWPEASSLISYSPYIGALFWCMQSTIFPARRDGGLNSDDRRLFSIQSMRTCLSDARDARAGDSYRIGDDWRDRGALALYALNPSAIAVKVAAQRGL